MTQIVRVKINGVLVAESDQVKQVEGIYYFPPDSIIKEHFIPTDTCTHCGRRGDASHYTVCGIEDVAWYYPHTVPEAKEIENHIAFYQNRVSIEMIG